MKNRIAIIGSASHIGLSAAVAMLEKRGVAVEIIAPEDAPKGLPDYAQKLNNDTLIKIENLRMEVSSLTPPADGQQRRRERRAKDRKKNRIN